MDYQEFKKRVASLKEVKSQKGKGYVSVHVIEDEVYYFRADAENSDKEEHLSLKKLYDFYKGNIFTTTEAKRYGLGGKQSPAVAFVSAI